MEKLPDKYVLPSKYKPNAKSNIHTLFNLYKYLEWPLCIKTIDINNLKGLSVLYKFFVAIYSIAITFALSWFCYVNILHVAPFQTLSFIIIMNMAYLSISMCYVAVVVHSAFFASKSGLDIYVSFTKIDSLLNLINDREKHKFLKTLLMLHIVYFLLRCFQIFIDVLAWSNVYMIIFYICTVVVDLKILNFYIICHSVAVRFEILNRNLIDSDVFKTDFELKSGMLTEIWSHILIEGRHKLDYSHCLAIYNRLADLIDHVNNYFGIPVSLFLILIISYLKLIVRYFNFSN